MPVKKIKKKRKKVAVKMKKEKKQIETDIKEAVEKIPEFLFSKVEMPPPQEEPQKKQAEKPQKNQPINYQLYRTRRLLLWLGVFVLTATIFGMWIWNVASFWQDAGKKTSAENGLWHEAKSGISALNKPFPNELQTALEQSQIKETIKQQLETELTKTKIKNVLEQAVAGYLATTSTAGTTTSKE